MCKEGDKESGTSRSRKGRLISWERQLGEHFRQTKIILREEVTRVRNGDNVKHVSVKEEDRRVLTEQK